MTRKQPARVDKGRHIRKWCFPFELFNVLYITMLFFIGGVRLWVFKFQYCDFILPVLHNMCIVCICSATAGFWVIFCTDMEILEFFFIHFFFFLMSMSLTLSLCNESLYHGMCIMSEMFFFFFVTVAYYCNTRVALIPWLLEKHFLYVCAYYIPTVKVINSKKAAWKHSMWTLRWRLKVKQLCQPPPVPTPRLIKNAATNQYIRKPTLPQRINE